MKWSIGSDDGFEGELTGFSKCLLKRFSEVWFRQERAVNKMHLTSGTKARAADRIDTNVVFDIPVVDELIRVTVVFPEEDEPVDGTGPVFALSCHFLFHNGSRARLRSDGDLLATFDPDVRKKLPLCAVRQLEPALDTRKIGVEFPDIDFHAARSAPKFYFILAHGIGAGHDHIIHMVGPAGMIDLVIIDAGGIGKPGLSTTFRSPTAS